MNDETALRLLNLPYLTSANILQITYRTKSSLVRQVAYQKLNLQSKSADELVLILDRNSDQDLVILAIKTGKIIDHNTLIKIGRKCKKIEVWATIINTINFDKIPVEKQRFLLDEVDDCEVSQLAVVNGYITDPALLTEIVLKNHGLVSQYGITVGTYLNKLSPETALDIICTAYLVDTILEILKTKSITNQTLLFSICKKYKNYWFWKAALATINLDSMSTIQLTELFEESDYEWAVIAGCINTGKFTDRDYLLSLNQYHNDSFNKYRYYASEIISNLKLQDMTYDELINFINNHPQNEIVQAAVETGIIKDTLKLIKIGIKSDDGSVWCAIGKIIDLNNVSGKAISFIVNNIKCLPTKIVNEAIKTGKITDSNLLIDIGLQYGNNDTLEIIAGLNFI
jgi:hypothetical protein